MFTKIAIFFTFYENFFITKFDKFSVKNIIKGQLVLPFCILSDN